MEITGAARSRRRGRYVDDSEEEDYAHEKDDRIGRRSVDYGSSISSDDSADGSPSRGGKKKAGSASDPKEEQEGEGVCGACCKGERNNKTCGGGSGSSTTTKKKEKHESEKAAIDAITAQDCWYTPNPWSKRQKRTSANTVDMLLARSQGLNTRRKMSASLGGAYIPNRAGRPLGIFQEKMYCGQFSTTGDVLLTASQDAVINLYDSQSVYQWSAKETDPDVDYQQEMQDEFFLRRGRYHSAPRQRATNEKAWVGAPHPIKTIRCLSAGWSVISTGFSPDEKWLAYSSWSCFVHLCNTHGEYELHESLDFCPKRGDAFCLFSIQFSPSNTHILGGASDKHVYLYSLERKERVARIRAHEDDVNAVAFADHGSQVVLSGGDDCVIKVWDLRSPDRAVGGLCGHQAGVTCITAKGDGHHFISNGKDQTLKLWDMRKMLDPKDKRMIDATVVPAWDYRDTDMRRPTKSKRRAPDASVRTFHGHKVLQTLIRCYFSPQHTTGQRFVMSGSSDGRVCIWDILTGEMVRSLAWHRYNTRDVSWHPYLPLIASFSWDASVGLWGYSAAPDGRGGCSER